MKLLINQQNMKILFNETAAMFDSKNLQRFFSSVDFKNATNMEKNEEAPLSRGRAQDSGCGSHGFKSPQRRDSHLILTSLHVARLMVGNPGSSHRA